MPLLVVPILITLLAAYRVYKFARFYQLEGYDSTRYLRWWVRNLPLALLWVPGGEVKQQFTRTQRAMRLVFTSMILVALLAFAGVFGSIIGVVVSGALAYLLAPVTYPLANILMYPVEAALRQGYLSKAKAALQEAGPTVIAITGSYGKTTTKEYIAHLLGARYSVLKTPKSYNTLMGVCRVINQMLPSREHYDYFIVEMGAYVTGEIAAICRLTAPQISLVTAVGPMHLERFGNIENTARAKYEIIEALPPDGAAIFNLDDPRVQAMDARGYPVQRFGVTRTDTPGARLRASQVRMTAEGLNFIVTDVQSGEAVEIRAPVYGDHNVTNILMALAVAQHVGIPLQDSALRAATLEPAEHRLVRRVLPNGLVTIDDAYSANPVGSRQALRVLDLHRNGKNKLAVITSGMIELGPIQDDENRKLGLDIAKVATDVILINPKQAEPVLRGLHEANFPPEHIHSVETTDAAIAWMTANAGAGDAVLIMSDLPDTY